MKRALDLSLFGLGLAVAVAILPGTVDAFLTLRWAILAVGVPLILILLGRDIAPFPWLVGAVVLCAAASLSWTVDAPSGFDETVHLAILAAAFWLGTSLSNATHLWNGLGVGVAVSSAIALAQWSIGWDAIPQAVEPGGLFANKNFLAEAALVALIPALFARTRLGLLIAAAALIAIALGSSKAVYAGLAVAVAFALAPRSPRLAWALIGALSLAALSAFWAFPILSATSRLDMWLPALADLRLVGHGVGAFSANWPGAEYAHSDPVQLLYEFGLLAAIPLIIFWQAMEAWSGEPEGYILVAIATVSLVSFPLHLPLTAFAAALAAGRLVGARDRLVRRRLDGRLALGTGA